MKIAKLTRKRVGLVAMALMALPVIALYLVPFFFPWSKLNCTHQEIDTSTGRVRISEYRLYFKISERVEDSLVSEILDGNEGRDLEPSWHHVNTFSPGTKHSPHHAYHGAFHQMRLLAGVWQRAESSGLADLEDFKKATARHLLALWRFDHSDWLADEYLSNFPDPTLDVDGATKLAALHHLKMPLYEVKNDQLTATVFFPDGQPMAQVEGYKNGAGVFVKHGLSKQWSADGTLAGVSQFVHGRYD